MVGENLDVVDLIANSERIFACREDATKYATTCLNDEREERMLVIFEIRAKPVARISGSYGTSEEAIE
jgi:hypothetical protein